MPRFLALSSIAPSSNSKDTGCVDPTAPPSWRFHRVMSTTHEPPDESELRDDHFVCTMREYRRRHKVTEAELAAEFPGPYFADRIAVGLDGDQRMRLCVEARILARQTDEEIAARLGTTALAIHWFEAIFFNVRPRLDSPDWLNIHLFNQTEWDHGFFEYAVQYNAYHGGVAALEFLLNNDIGRNQPDDVYPDNEEELKKYIQDQAVSFLAKIAVLTAQSGRCRMSTVNSLIRAFRSTMASIDDENNGDKRQMNDTHGRKDARQRRKKKLMALDTLVTNAVGRYGEAK